MCSACSTQTERYQSYFLRAVEYDAFYDNATDATTINKPVRGIIAPHHLLVGTQMATLYESLANQNPSIVVIIGPDHDGAGVSRVVTTDIGYDTPYGSLDVETSLATQLTAIPFIQVDRRAFTYEHSINSHTAFIRRTFGNVPILPIMVHGTTTLDEAEALARTLNAILPDDALVIASVDFSHYLPEWIANLHDRVSESVIDAFDINALPTLEVDSPASLATLQMYLSMRDAKTIVYRDHTNSASVTHAPHTFDTTSHVYRAFADGPVEERPAGISLLFYGDSMFDRGVQAIADKQGEAAILDDIARMNDRFFLGVDLSVLNLESPITDATFTANAPVIFKSDATLATSILRRMSVDVLSFNNNHVFDAGDDGVSDTLSFAHKQGMHILHPDEPCQNFRIRQRSVALCAFDDSRATINIDSATAVLKHHAETSDWVVVSIHWGQEYRSEPSDRERSIAAKLIAAGADAIVGHGPHVVQPIEDIDGVPVAFSIGNFLFDQFEDGTNVGLMLGLWLGDDGLELTPIPFTNANGKLELMPYDER